MIYTNFADSALTSNANAKLNKLPQINNMKRSKSALECTQTKIRTKLGTGFTNGQLFNIYILYIKVILFCSIYIYYICISWLVALAHLLRRGQEKT